MKIRVGQLFYCLSSRKYSSHICSCLCKLNVHNFIISCELNVNLHCFFYQTSGIAAELSGLGASLTILVPANSAFDKIDNSTMRFLTSTDVV